MSNEDRVKQVISEIMIVDEAELTPGSTLEGDLGADFLDHAELTMKLEEEFDLEIPDDDSGNWKTVKDVLDYIAEKVK
jgi:acyl carrier protein